MSGDDATRGSGPVADLDRIRAELEAEIERSGLRAVARAVGMSPTGLSKVLAGSTPYRQTLSKLRAWQRHRRSPGETPTAEELALETLLERLPEPRRNEARQQIRRILDGGSSEV